MSKLHGEPVAPLQLPIELRHLRSDRSWYSKLYAVIRVGFFSVASICMSSRQHASASRLTKGLLW